MSGSDSRRVRRKRERAERKHATKIARAHKRFDRELRDPELLAELGLPEDLPESTREILAQAQALSEVGGLSPVKTMRRR